MASQINAVNTSLSGQTGTGEFAGSTSPTFTTPNIGAASASSINFGGSSLANYASDQSWTPTFSFTTPGNVNVTYISQHGNYSQIGNIVICAFSVLASSITYSTASGDFIIGNLPFTSANVNGNINSNAVSIVGFSYPASTTSILAIVGQNNNYMTFTTLGSNALGNVTTTQVTSGSSVIAQGCIIYQI